MRVAIAPGSGRRDPSDVSILDHHASALIAEAGPWLEPPGVASQRARAREFARRVLEPRALSVDAALGGPHALGSADWEVLRSATQEGLMTSMAPRAFGGSAARSSEVAVVTEELSAVCGGLALLIGANSLGLAGLLFSLDIGLWMRVVKPAARERFDVPKKPTLFAWAITEPSSGSDVEHADGLERVVGPTWAERVPGGYRLFGRKSFTSNGSIARWVVVHAALDRARPRQSWSAFLVDTERSGFRAARDETKLGQRASPATETVYDGVFVPELDRVGPEGSGFAMTELILAASRAPVGAIATGIARGALEATIRAVRRLPADHPGSAAQGWVKDSVAEMTARVHQSRLAYLDAALGFDASIAPKSWLQAAIGASAPVFHAAVAPERLKRLSETGFSRMLAELEQSGALRAQLTRASLAKASCADASMWVCDLACDLVPLGAAERPLVEKALRDVKLTQIYEGTNQINRLTVGEYVLASR
jgi:butyryl-CoA dehydrogenase